MSEMASERRHVMGPIKTFGPNTPLTWPGKVYRVVSGCENCRWSYSVESMISDDAYALVPIGLRAEFDENVLAGLVLRANDVLADEALEGACPGPQEG